MLLFIYLRLSKPESIRRFNTSHVTLYRQRCSWLHYRSDVSIHHMLLFIQEPMCRVHPRRGFNTSHVTLYHKNPDVMIYGNEFQYITCYSLSLLSSPQQHLTAYVSIHHMLLFITISLHIIFHRIIVSIHHMLLFISNHSARALRITQFQYITCYSLSQLGWLIMQLAECFNTSHVTLYRLRIPCLLVVSLCFNTSHVTLYLSTLTETAL